MSGREEMVLVKGSNISTDAKGKYPDSGSNPTPPAMTIFPLIVVAV